MNRSERSDVPFLPSQIAQPEGVSIVALPLASRLNAECGGNQAITVLAGVSGAFAPDVAMIMTSALELPARRVVCLHGPSADVMAITKWSIARASSLAVRQDCGGNQLPDRRRGNGIRICLAAIGTKAD